MSVSEYEKVIICHVEHQFEAESISEALNAADIKSAYCHTPRSGGVFAMPGAIGIDDLGYDVMVAKGDVERSNEVLAGMGLAQPAEPTKDNCEAAADDAEASAPTPEERLENELEQMGPVRAALAKFGAILLVLLMIAFCTWGVDAIIAMIKSML